MKTVYSLFLDESQQVLPLNLGLFAFVKDQTV